MERTLSLIFSNPVYAMGVAGAVMLVWLLIQKNRDKECKLTNSMILRNSVFVALLVGVALHFGRYKQILEEGMDARGADF